MKKSDNNAKQKVVGEKVDKTVNKGAGIMNESEFTAPNLAGKIYEIRGERVMLDADLAEIYGYTTSAFNQQVMRNAEKFEGEEFMFQLTREEVDMLPRLQLVDFGNLNLRCQNGISSYRDDARLRCQNDTLNNINDKPLKSQNVTSSLGSDSLRSQNVILNAGLDSLRSQNVTLKNGRGEHSKYLPYAFTEQGIYMLMTVLRGELATKQSRALVMMFKQMKDYIIENQGTLDERSQLKMLAQVAQNSQQIAEIKSEMDVVEDKLTTMADKMNDAVMRSEIAPVLLDFKQLPEKREYLFINGEPARAKETYIEIYRQARRSIAVIDNYIDIRTLRTLGQARDNVEITIFSDNSGSYLHKSDLKDFATEFPDAKLQIFKTGGVVHDRFIIIDRGLSGEKVYHCGASAKDAGNKITAVTELQDELVKNALTSAVEKMFGAKKLF